MITPSLKPTETAIVSVQKIQEQSLQTLKTDPLSFCANLQVRNIEQHFLSPTLNISQLQKQLGDLGNERVRALLNIILTDTILFFQVGKMMGPDQVIETVGFILEDFKHLKPEDFVLCFNKAKKGHYGQLFDRLDGQIMLSWLTTYDNERTAIVESVHARENRQIKQSTTAVIGQPDNPDEVFARNIAKLKERLENNKRLRMAQQEQSKPADNYNAAYVKHQHWLAKFDKVHATKPMDAKGGRFIYRYGRVLDVNAFLEHKQWQYNEFVIKGRKPYEVK